MQKLPEQLKRQLQSSLRKMQIELDRVEILAAALDGFSVPVPDYESGFHHYVPLGHELKRFEIEP